MLIPDRVAVGHRLRAIRITRRSQVPPRQKDQWSIGGVARRIGVHGSTISRLERGRFSSSDILESLASLYGVSMAYILTGEGEEERQIRIDRIVGKIMNMSSMNLSLLEAVIDQIEGEEDVG